MYIINYHDHALNRHHNCTFCVD